MHYKITQFKIVLPQLILIQPCFCVTDVRRRSVHSVCRSGVMDLSWTSTSATARKDSTIPTEWPSTASPVSRGRSDDVMSLVAARGLALRGLTRCD